ncbi:MAG: WXG100 family type VII secretion target [Mycobacteriaceae bacterium]
MAGTVGTNLEQMEATAKKVAQVNDEVQALLRGLKGKIDGVGSAWQGNAQSAFMNVSARWDEQAQKLNQSLLAISENISANGKQFASTQEDHVSALNNAGGSLNW